MTNHCRRQPGRHCQDRSRTPGAGTPGWRCEARARSRAEPATSSGSDQQPPSDRDDPSRSSPAPQTDQRVTKPTPTRPTGAPGTPGEVLRFGAGLWRLHSQRARWQTFKAACPCCAGGEREGIALRPARRAAPACRIRRARCRRADPCPGPAGLTTRLSLWMRLFRDCHTHA